MLVLWFVWIKLRDPEAVKSSDVAPVVIEGAPADIFVWNMTLDNCQSKGIKGKFVGQMQLRVGVGAVITRRQRNRLSIGKCVGPVFQIGRAG